MRSIKLTLVIFFLLCQHWSSHAQSPSNDIETYSENGKFGLVKVSTQERIIPARFDALGWSDGSFSIIDGVIGFKNNETWGLLTLENEIIVNSKYTVLYPYKNKKLIAGKRSRFSILSKYGIISTKGSELLPLEYESLVPFGDRLMASKRVDGFEKSGLLTENGKVIIPIIHESVESITDGLLRVQNSAGLNAVYDLNGKQKSPFEFEMIEQLDADHFLVSLYDRKGILNSGLQLVAPTIYKSIEEKDGNYVGQPFSNWSLLNSENELLQSFFLDKITPLNNSSFIVQTNENLGIIDESEEYSNYLPGLTLVEHVNDISIVKDSQFYGALDSSGKQVLPIQYDSVFIEGKTIFAKINGSSNDNWTPYDFSGEKAGYFSYEIVRRESLDRLRARRNEKWGFLDDRANEVSPFLYDSLGKLNAGFAKVHYQGRFGVIDENGIWIVTPYRDEIELTSTNILYSQGSESGIMDLQGNILYRTRNQLRILGPLFVEETPESKQILLNKEGARQYISQADSILHIEPSLYLILDDNQWHIYNHLTKVTLELPKTVQLVKSYEEDLISVMIDNKWGFIEESGRLRIANRYDSVQHFSEGLSAIKLIGKWGFIDRQEKLIIQPTYDQVSPFYGQLTVVRKGKSYGLIDKTGDEILEVKYDKVERFEDYILFYSKGKIGFADRFGTILRNPQFDTIQQIDKKNFLISKDNLYGVISIKGLDVIPIRYQEIIPFNGKFLTREKSEPQLIKLN